MKKIAYQEEKLPIEVMENEGSPPPEVILTQIKADKAKEKKLKIDKRKKKTSS